ncbi:MAG: hypothetical protein EXS16_16825 [Gemmataceae bacterium]|nr:hypothetical protein [Gemmataceae bacterium]
MNAFSKKIWLALLLALISLLFGGNFAAVTATRGDGNTVILSGFFIPNRADDPSVECTPRIHYANLIAGNTYFIRLNSSEANTWLSLENEAGNCVALDSDLCGEIGGSILYRPAVTERHRIFVGARMPIDVGFYTLTIRELPVLFEMFGDISPAEEWANHSTELAFEKDRRYVIEVNSDAFPAIARLMNAEGVIVAFDDEGCMTNCTRIIYTAPRTEVYRLEVSSHTLFVGGAFRMTVSEF